MISTTKKPRYSYRITRLFYVVLPGFEPGQTGPESVVLPLHHRTIFNKSPTLLLADAKVYTFSKFANKLSKKMSRKNTYVFRIKHVHVFSKAITHILMKEKDVCNELRSIFATWKIISIEINGSNKRISKNDC